MKKIAILFILTSFCSFSQSETSAFTKGEFLKFEISYGILNAGIATLEVNSFKKNEVELIHVNGKGWTTGMVNFFFSVEDNYQTYFHPKTLKPFHFIRKVNEGGYTKDKEIFFDYQDNKAKVIDHKHNTENLFDIPDDVHDMISVLYFLRNKNYNNLEAGEIITLNMFFDEKINVFKFKFVGRDVVKSKFGKVKTLIFKPMVQSGRVFKDNETVTFWISDDQNKIPIRVKAEILVGSINVKLATYKGLANPFSAIND